MVALWCLIVVSSVLLGIGLRNGSIHLGRAPAGTLSFVRLDRQPPARIPELTLVCGYYDRLEMSPVQRRALAEAISDSTISATSLLSSLQVFFSDAAHTSIPARTSDYGVFEFHQPGTP